MEAYKRGSGRPRKDGLVRDAEGNLRDPGGHITTEEKWATRAPEENEAAAEPTSNDAVIQEMAAELRRLREQVESQAPQQDKITGKWDYHYKNQPHLRVFGGLEVDHQPGFMPHPPSGIPMYEAVGGGTTDHLEAPVKKYMKMDGMGNPQLGEDGQAQHTEVPVAKAATRDANGDPILTHEYKVWLHLKARGKRLDSNAMSDIAAGKGLPAGSVASQEVEFNDAGVPVTSD
jgi:hypothetical protein